MTENELKKNIIAIGRLLWEKDLASGLNGNISVRNADGILLTGHSTCLGMLKEEDILRVALDGKLLDEGNISTENLLHRCVYQNFPEVAAVVHTHTTYTNGYFLENENFDPKIFEARLYLGEVQSVPQDTPSVTDTAPVVAALMNNNIIVLRNHGVVAMGKNLFDCFLLIQALEEGIKTDAISRLYQVSVNSPQVSGTENRKLKTENSKKYKLFSQEQIDAIVKLVNADSKLVELGAKTDMTMDLAVKLNETGEAYKFCFRKGNIAEVSRSEDAEFLITAPESVWRAVFNREIDPFVATTQKKMHLQGDFAKISKWYAPCSRVFELWANVPVE